MKVWVATSEIESQDDPDFVYTSIVCITLSLNIAKRHCASTLVWEDDENGESSVAKVRLYSGQNMITTIDPYEVEES